MDELCSAWLCSWVTPFPFGSDSKAERRWRVSSARFLTLLLSRCLLVVLLFILLVAWTRYLSLGSVVAAGLFPFAMLDVSAPGFAGPGGSHWQLPFVVIWRHADNIQRIRAGNERVFRFRRTVG